MLTITSVFIFHVLIMFLCDKIWVSVHGNIGKSSGIYKLFIIYEIINSEGIESVNNTKWISSECWRFYNNLDKACNSDLCCVTCYMIFNEHYSSLKIFCLNTINAKQFSTHN